MLSLAAITLAAIQAALWLTGQRTLSHRPVGRAVALAVCAGMAGHLIYEWVADDLGEAAARNFIAL